MVHLNLLCDEFKRQCFRSMISACAKRSFSCHVSCLVHLLKFCNIFKAI
jgi:hypothetical protein